MGLLQEQYWHDHGCLEGYGLESGTFHICLEHPGEFGGESFTSPS